MAPQNGPRSPPVFAHFSSWAANMICTQGVRGSNPLVSTSPTATRVSAILPRQKSPKKQMLTPQTDFQTALESVLLSRRVGNCSSRSVDGYAGTLQRFATTLGIQDLRDVTPLGVQKYLSYLGQTMKPVSVHHYFRPLKTFFRWCVETDLLPKNPTRGITIRTPRILPRVPEDDDVRRLIQRCSQTFEGHRNRALIALLADSGLRISEALRLRIESVNFSTRTLDVRGGNGGKDGVGFFGAEAAQMLRSWLRTRRDAAPEDYLFVDRMGRSLTRNHATQSDLVSVMRGHL